MNCKFKDVPERRREGVAGKLFAHAAKALATRGCP